MGVASTSETLVSFHQTTQHYNPAESLLHTCRLENLKLNLKLLSVLLYLFLKMTNSVRSLLTAPFKVVSALICPLTHPLVHSPTLQLYHVLNLPHLSDPLILPLIHLLTQPPIPLSPILLIKSLISYGTTHLPTHPITKAPTDGLIFFSLLRRHSSTTPTCCKSVVIFPLQLVIILPFRTWL
jgi:hypothetical protein